MAKNNDGIETKKKLTKQGILVIIILVIGIITIGAFGYYRSGLKAVSKKDEEVIVTIDEGMTPYQIAERLAENKAIKSSAVFKFYIKRNKISGFKFGTYKLNKNMDVEEIIAELQKGSNYYPDNVNITFLEGKHMRWLAKLIASKTSITEEEVFNKQKDEAYLDTLIEKYWFLTDEIKNDNIYYPLEGYLFPDTYNFKANVTIEEIFKTMLDEMENKLEPYKAKLQTSSNSIHQYLTMASIVEQEANDEESRKGVAQVFYNRLRATMSLGSDVTTYYGLKVDMSERNLTTKEIMQANSYNTRSTAMIGKLPVGPIGTISISSLEAALYGGTSKEGYFYFVADKNGKIYFTKNETEHNAKIKELKQQGLWFTY